MHWPLALRNAHSVKLYLTSRNFSRTVSAFRKSVSRYFQQQKIKNSLQDTEGILLNLSISVKNRNQMPTKMSACLSGGQG